MTTQTYYVIQLRITGWIDWMRGSDLADMTDRYRHRKERRENATGPSSHIRLIQRDETVLETTEPPSA